MTATEVVTVPRMAEEHREWERDHLQWRQDVEVWLQEHRSVVAYLNRLADLVEDHGVSLERHREAFERHDSQVHNHEYLTHYHPDSRDTVRSQVVLAEEHLRSVDEHAHQYDEHKRLEREHRVLMAHLAMLRSAIDAAQGV